MSTGIQNPNFETFQGHLSGYPDKNLKKKETYKQKRKINGCPTFFKREMRKFGDISKTWGLVDTLYHFQYFPRSHSYIHGHGKGSWLSAPSGYQKPLHCRIKYSHAVNKIAQLTLWEKSPRSAFRPCL